MSISEFEANEFVTRNNVNSRITAINNMFPVSVTNGGTGATTSQEALYNLDLVDKLPLDFPASTAAEYISKVQTHVAGKLDSQSYVPYTCNAGWQGQSYGAALGVRTWENNNAYNDTLVIFNEKIGVKIYHGDHDVGWKDYSPTGIVLYENSSGTQSTVVLSESAANFSRIKIYYQHNDGEHSSTDIYDPNGKTTLLSTVKFRDNNYTYLSSAKIAISGTSITWGSDHGYNRLATTPAINRNDGIFLSILKVVGFRN